MGNSATAREWHAQAQGNKRCRKKPELPQKLNGKSVKALGSEGLMGAKAEPSKAPGSAEAKKAGRNGDAGFWKPTTEYLEDVKLRRLGVVEATNNSDTPFWMMG